jgi:hypothetical protein
MSSWTDADLRVGVYTNSRMELIREYTSFKGLTLRARDIQTQVKTYVRIKHGNRNTPALAKKIRRKKREKTTL